LLHEAADAGRSVRRRSAIAWPHLATKGIVMAFVNVHPQYRQLLAEQGLVTAADFLAIAGVVCCGHPDRHVARVTLGTGPMAVPAFLKREHRTRWRDRLSSAWAGFGFASKSQREFAVLRMVEATDIGSPQAIAAGEDDEGRAFLLIREVDGCQDLRQVLGQATTTKKRRAVARRLGVALARLHGEGFEHPDLYSKHVLVSQQPRLRRLAICFLDWQRVRRRPVVTWKIRLRDLAALDATLADDLATPRQRLLVLRTYLRAIRTPKHRWAGLTLTAIAHEIRRRSLRLLERRRIREMRQPPLAVGTQNLIWLDGEALQVTREFLSELGGQIPAWLNAKKVSGPFSAQTVPLPGSGLAHLVTRSVSRPWQWLWAWLRRRPLVAPELESMHLLFRLQRYGVVLPRLLAAGQKSSRPWQTQSFLLTEPLPEAVPLPKFLLDADPATCRQTVRQAARVLRQIHQATCYLNDGSYEAISAVFAVCHDGGKPAVALATVHGIEKSTHPNPVRARRDLAAIAQALTGACGKTDLMRALLDYTGQRHLTPAVKRFARRVLERLPKAQRRRRIAA
jgi:hypothetical protein